MRVGAAYVVIGWILAQVAEFAFENFGAPEWVLKSFVVALLLGLPLALFFAWAFEITPEGVKREKDVDRSKSITHSTGRRLDFVIIGALILALGYFVWERQNLIDATGVVADADETSAVGCCGGPVIVALDCCTIACGATCCGTCIEWFETAISADDD